MSQPIRGQSGNLVFAIGQKNTNLVEDVEILLPVKFYWIPFSGFRIEVENVSANQRQGRPSCFSDRPQKHKLGRGCWVFASCQVSLNSVQWFQRRSRKCEKLINDGRTDDGQHVITIVHLSLRLRCTKNPYDNRKQEAQRAIYRAPEYNMPLFWQIGKDSQFCILIRMKSTNLVQYVILLLPAKFRWILFSDFREWFRKCLGLLEARAAILFFRLIRKTQTL